MKLVLIILILLLIVSAAVGWIFFSFTFTRKGRALPGKKRLAEGEADLRAWKKYREKHEADYAWLMRQEAEEISIKSEDGLKLAGKWFRSKNPERIIICAHGYRGQAEHDFAGVSRYLHAQHCDLLLIDQRGHQKSEGDYITFGAKEKEDIRAWCSYVQAHNPDHLPVYLYGISMGCATVLLSSILVQDNGIRGIIADCGYSSMEKILSEQSWKAFHVPPYPPMYFMDLICRKKANFRMADGNVSETLKRCTIPVLFFHGTEDHFVPKEHTMRNYEACASEKELVLIEGGVHASSYYENTPLYQESLNAFFAKLEKHHG